MGTYITYDEAYTYWHLNYYYENMKLTKHGRILKSLTQFEEGVFELTIGRTESGTIYLRMHPGCWMCKRGPRSR
jgi:hypothetical protein